MKKLLLSLIGLSLAAVVTAQNNDGAKFYGDNLITATPLSILDKGLGIGVSYERMLDQEQKIAFVIPVDFIFDDMNENWDGNESNSLFYSYFSPGLIFYPSGLRKVNYGVGPNLVFGYGTGTEWRQNSFNGVQRLEDYTNFRMGLMVNNYLLFNIKQHFSLQINFGMGIRYINSYKWETTTEKDPLTLMGQFKLAFGYRF